MIFHRAPDDGHAPTNLFRPARFLETRRAGKEERGGGLQKRRAREDCDLDYNQDAMNRWAATGSSQAVPQPNREVQAIRRQAGLT